MPRSFSTWHGRRPDPKLFSVPSDSTPPSSSYGEALDKVGDESLDVDLQTLVDNLLGTDGELPDAQQQGPSAIDSSAADAAVASASAMQIEAGAGHSGLEPSPIVRRDSCSVALGHLTLQTGGHGASSGEPLPQIGETAPMMPLGLTPIGQPDSCGYLQRSLSDLPQTPGSETGGLPLQRTPSCASDVSSVPSAPPLPAASPSDAPSFTWSECHNLISTDAAGIPVRQPTSWPAVKMHVQLQLPLLYWGERRRWMWHKKWTLPKVHVRVSCDGQPVGGGFLFPGEPPVYAVMAAGTLRDDGGESEGGSLHDQGLGGECQRRLVAGEATFSSLVFRHTSFNCGNRPFHLVVAVFAPAHHPLAMAALSRGELTTTTGIIGGDVMPHNAAGMTDVNGQSSQRMVALGCVCSSPIIVDARKRTKGERPEADASDVRLVQRQRGAVGHSQKLPMPQHGLACGPPGVHGHPAAAAAAQAAAQAAAAQAGLGGPQQWPPQAHGKSQFDPQLAAWAMAQQGGGAPNPAAAVAAAQALESEVGIFDACGDAVLELGDGFVVRRLLGRTAFGYDPAEIVSTSVLAILHAQDHQPFLQTAQALLAMAGSSPNAEAAPQAVRALHRVFYKRSGTAEVMVDSIITAKPPAREGLPPTLIISSRNALPTTGGDADGHPAFRVFPVGPSNRSPQ